MFAPHLFPFGDGYCARLQLSPKLCKKILPLLSHPVSQVIIILRLRLSRLACLGFSKFSQVVGHGGIDPLRLYFGESIFGGHDVDRGMRHVWRREYVDARSFSNFVGEWYQGERDKIEPATSTFGNPKRMRRATNAYEPPTRMSHQHV